MKGSRITELIIKQQRFVSHCSMAHWDVQAPVSPAQTLLTLWFCLTVRD